MKISEWLRDRGMEVARGRYVNRIIPQRGVFHYVYLLAPTRADDVSDADYTPHARAMRLLLAAAIAESEGQ